MVKTKTKAFAKVAGGALLVLAIGLSTRLPALALSYQFQAGVPSHTALHPAIVTAPHVSIARHYYAGDVQISPLSPNYSSPQLPLINQVIGIIDAPNGKTGSLTPEGLAVNPAGTRAYVADLNGGRIDVINTANNSVITKIAVGGEFVGVVINSSGTKVYAANSTNGTISVISTRTNKVIDTIVIGAPVNGIGPAPYALALNHAGTTLYVVNQRGNTVSVVSTATDSMVATIPVGVDPLALAVSPNGSQVYVACSGSGGATSSSVSVISTASNKVVASIPLGANAYGVAFNSTGDRAYISNGDSRGNGIISVINTRSNSVVGSINLGFGRFPEWIAVTPDGTRAYIPDETSGEVSVIDLATNSLITTFRVGGNPVQIAFINGSEAYIGNQTSGLQVLQIMGQGGQSLLIPLQTLGHFGANPLPPDSNVSEIWNGTINSIGPTLSNYIQPQKDLTRSNHDTLITIVQNGGNGGSHDGHHEDHQKPDDDQSKSGGSGDADITVDSGDDEGGN